MTDKWFNVRYGHYHIWYTKYIMFEWPIDEKIFPISGCRWRNREKGAVRRNPNTEPARRLNSDTMSKICFSYFKTYISKLLKLQVSKYHFLLVDFLPIFFASTRKFSHRWSSLDRITQLSVLKGSSYSVTKDSPSFESFSPILSHVTLD